eukprot:2717556-Rhodomonas_salina.2
MVVSAVVAAVAATGSNVFGLQVCYAISGTLIASAAFSPYASAGTLIAYAVISPSASAGTAFGETADCACTRIAHDAISLCQCYAMRGTDIA